MKHFFKQSSFLVLITFSLIFASCESNGDALLIEEQDQIQALDPAKIIDLSTLIKGTDSRAVLRGGLLGNNNRFVSSENGSRMTCNRTWMRSWETFTFEPDPNRPYRYYIKANNGKYVRRESGYPYLRSFADKSHAEQFFFVNAGNGKVGVYAWNIRRYVSSENGNGSITCNSTSIGSSEKFDLALIQ